MGRFSELLFAWRVERYNAILEFLARARFDAVADREEVIRDLEHTDRLIVNYKLRIQALREFQLNAELRLPKIEEELDSMPTEDLDRGWTEALAAEFTKLTRQMSLSSEELHLRKLQLRQAKVRAYCPRPAEHHRHDHALTRCVCLLRRAGRTRTAANGAGGGRRGAGLTLPAGSATCRAVASHGNPRGRGTSVCPLKKQRLPGWVD